ncbi:MAG TPA: tetratricopeptide repeat protein [Rectinemataceae bacterium]|nr:tetratricopeptide repeat protein [Rectinemataceae bacterium]
MSFIVILIIILGVAVGFLSWFIVRMVAAPRQSKAIADLLKQGKSSQAARAAKSLLAKDPRNSVAHWFLGKAYLADGKPELALMELKAVNQIGQFGPELPELEFRTAIAALFERFNQTEEALKEHILLSKLDPSNAGHFLDAGRLFESRGKTDVAVNYLRKALEMDARLHAAHHTLGLILYRTKHPMEAKTEFEAALKWNPDDFEAFYYLGKILKEMSDFTASLLAFEKASRAPELRLKCLVERGGCYMSQGALDKAISELERAVKLIKDETAAEALYARYFLAMCYEKTRNLDKAIEQWERIYAKKPGFRDVAEKLTQYQEYRTDDRMKDFLTCGKEEFVELCKAIVQGPMSLSIRDIGDVSNGVDIIAVEGESEKWMGAKKLPRLIRFLRVSDNLDDGAVRSLLDQMKKLGVVRGCITTSAGFTRTALEFAENRSVELLTKEKLQELLARASLPASRRR